MVDQVLVSRAIGMAGLLPAVLLLGLFAFAVAQRLRGRSVGRRWQHLLALAAGLHVGFAVLITTRVLVLTAVALLAGLLVALWLAWHGRRAAAGWFALGVALPWTMFWGLGVVLVATGAAIEPFQTVAAFLLGAVPCAVATGVILAGDPPAPEPRPDAPLGQPGSRRIGTLATGFRAAMSVGPITTMELAGLLTVFAVGVGVSSAQLPVPPLLEAAVVLVVATLLGTQVAIRAAPRRVRRALEAFGWLGEWELERARRMGFRQLITTERAAEHWLATVPDRPANRSLRWELLLLVGRLDEARDVALRMPQETPYERFERAYALDRLEWAAGGPGDIASVRAVAEAIGPPSTDDRLRADVALAVRAGQQLTAEGRDALGPLVEVRERLGDRRDVRLGALFVARTRQAMLLVALVVVVLFYGIDPIADAVVELIRAAGAAPAAS